MIEAYHWIMLGLTLVAAEIFLASFFIVWFGLGALCVAAALWLVPDIEVWTQLLLFAGFSTVATTVSFKVLRRPMAPAVVAAAHTEAVGECGVLVKEIAVAGVPSGMPSYGRVRFQRPILGSDEWPCYANAPIEQGARVKLVSINGIAIQVARA